MDVAVVDYGVGNLFSLVKSLSAVGASAVVTSEANVISSAKRLILPGVGAFGDASEKLFSSGLGEAVKKHAAGGKPLLGICLGMQLLFEKSFEYGEHAGLSLIPGDVVFMKEQEKQGLIVPHMGWNSLDIKRESPILEYTKNGEFVYFVHSYFARTEKRFVTASSVYGGEITACVQNKNVFGCQFHPEKSGAAGLGILRAFCETEA